MSDLISRQAAIMDAESWVAVDEYEKNLQKKVVEWLKEFQPAELGTNLAEVGTDTISRQAVIDALDEQIAQCNKALKSFVLSMKDEYAAKVEKASLTAFRERLEYLPPAQPESNYDEWCTDCKEYDHENHCCHRWTKVIRQTRRELQDEFVMTAVDGTLWVTVNDVQKVGRVIVDEEKSKFCRQFYMDAKPEQRTGKCMWCERLKERNLRIEYYWIDEEGCTASFSEPHIVATGIAKFCPNCGAKMEGGAE